MKHTFFLFVTALLLGIQSHAQTGVAINPTGAEADSSAMLDVSSTTKGLLVPRMTLAQRIAIANPVKGLLVFQNDGTEGFYYYDGSAWTNLSLVNFTESNFTFDSKTGVKFTPNNAETDVDMILQPKGTGAIIAQQPDGTTAGGNNRGGWAVDLQMYRTNASQIASGDFSTIVGGGINSSQGLCSVVIGGSYNISSGDFSLAMGNSSHATATYSTALGKNATASNEYAVAIGKNPIASGYASLSIGDYTTASGLNSTAFGNRNTAPSAYETVFGRYNTDYTPTSSTDWIATDRLFIVGNGAADASRSNALTILKNANATIGGSLTINGNGTNTSYLFPATRGTSGQVLQTDGVGGTSWATPYTGLTNFTESHFTYTTKTGVKFTPNNAATDVDMILQPKGLGAIIAQQPDGTTAGGNKRGSNAVDLQMFRIYASQAASGDYATIAGGAFNTASGKVSTAMGISTIASGEFSTTLGSYTTASGVISTAMGSHTTASGTFSTAMGENSVASGQHSIAMGNSATASNEMSFAVGSYTNAIGNTSTAFGFSSTASGYGSFSSGLGTQATGDFSTTAGGYTIAPSVYEMVVGRYNTTYTPGSSTDWNISDRLFVVGNGAADASRSNALTILKNANATIGGSLTINGNGTNTSYLFPETRGTSGQVLQTDGVGGTSWATPYTGLTNFTESNFTYDSKAGVKFTPNHGYLNVDMILQPKGTGAIIAQQPNGATTGGNKKVMRLLICNWAEPILPR